MKAKTKSSYDPSEKFLEYQQFIVSHPAYAGMPDLYCEDGSIQWEAPSNRQSGQFKDTHDKRLLWWKKKAEEVGISVSENEWRSKVAKKIHPTQMHPCKKCGRLMDIRYLYLNDKLLKRLDKAGYDIAKLHATYTTSILDFIGDAYRMYGQRIFLDLPRLLKCSAVRDIPIFHDLTSCQKWLIDVYAQKKTFILGPGVMANPPDRLDGFHSFNRCCRSSADKGRSKENLASYATDRRAFEYWSDGNWIAANKLMGLIRTDPHLSKLECHCRGDGHEHPTPCSADHIGPISLGFCHRPMFQLLCVPCNSAKNNRMFLSDVKCLIQCENNGEKVVSWYAKAVWDALKSQVHTQDDATRLSRVMRDNRFNALLMLGRFLNKNGYLFLFHLLDLSYGDFTYSLQETFVKGDYVTASFEKKKCSTQYGLEQKARKVRVAFESLRDYLEKSQRNGAQYMTVQSAGLLKSAVDSSRRLSSNNKLAAQRLASVIENDEISEEELRDVIREMPDLHSDNNFVDARCTLVKLMSIIGTGLASKWTSDRYCRDLNYDQSFNP